MKHVLFYKLTVNIHSDSYQICCIKTNNSDFFHNGKRYTLILYIHIYYIAVKSLFLCIYREIYSFDFKYTKYKLKFIIR